VEALKRLQLIREIDVLDQRLDMRQRRFRAVSRESGQAVRRLHPFWLIGIGLVTGFAMRRLGWRRIRSLGFAGFKMVPFGFRVGRKIARFGEGD
jgi:hypothetical protein